MSRLVKSEFGNVSRPKPTDEKGWIGAEGERGIFFLKYTGYRSTQKGFNVYSFVDEIGNKVISFSNGLYNEEDKEVLPKFCYLIKATVKRHQVNDYENNSKDTVVNRIKILKTIGWKPTGKKEDES